MLRTLLFVLALASPVMAQTLGSASKVTVRALLSSETVAPGSTFRLAVVLDLENEWHINAHKPTFDYLIGTTLELEPTEGVIVADLRYPAGKSMKFDFADQAIDVYDHEAIMFAELRVSSRLSAGPDTIRGRLTIQACNNEVCLAPSRIPIAVPITISSDAAGNESLHAEIFSKFSSDDYAQLESSEGDLAGMFETEGSLFAFFAIFLIGLALNLTPCVYPMLSVTVSLFGSQTQDRISIAALRAIIYVLGIATMYTVLGVSAALSGGLFGSWLQSPWVLGGIGLLLFGLALSSFGVYQIQIPYWLTSRLGGQTSTGMIGLYLSGLVVGVFAAPCIGPPVIALLTLVGAKGDPLFGFQAFFSLSLGLGFPYLILGTFSGLLTKIPKSGPWMVWVERIFGVVLTGAALFYGALAFAPKYSVMVVPATLILGGLYLGFLDPSGRGRKILQRVQWVTGIVAIVVGVMMARSIAKPAIEWEEFTEERLQHAQANDQFVMMDFSADWCIPCKELELNTFTDEGVINATRDAVRLKVDLTQFDSPESEALRRKFNISGVPTILFLAPDGSEVSGTRILGYVPPDEFLTTVQRARGE